VAGGPSAASFDPGRYDQFSVTDLLQAASRGWVGVDRRLLESLLRRGESAAQELLAFSRENHERDRIGLEFVLADLFRQLHPPEAIDFYLDLIRREPLEVEDSIVEALLSYREQALEPLLKLYEELGEEQGADTAFVLAGLRVRDPRTLHILLERLEFDTADGAFLLGLYGDGEARPALEKMLAEIPEENVELRREITHAVEELAAPEPEYQPEQFDVLSEYPEREIPEFDVLPETERIEFLESADPEIRAGAAHSFFNSELQPGARNALLKVAQSDPDANVRGRAWESLADAAAESEAIRSEMLAVLADSSRPFDERGGAAVGLYAVTDVPEIQQRIEALYTAGGQARAKAMEAMWRSLYDPFAKYFAPNLKDPDSAIVREALRGAGYFRLTTHSDTIKSYFDNDDLREDALFAYALAMPGETTRGRAQGMVRKINSISQLSRNELRVVMFGIDERLRLHGLDPVFEDADADLDESEPEPEPEKPSAPAKVGRNDPRPCGSGKKYKKCHGA
jgi:hypothetical protein